MLRRLLVGHSRPALGAAILLVVTSVSAEAKTCWPYGTVIATARIAVKNSTAKKYVRINWRAKVRSIATLGTAYTNGDLAEQRDYNASKSSVPGVAAPSHSRVDLDRGRAAIARGERRLAHRWNGAADA
jgi:hypothetical protein